MNPTSVNGPVTRVHHKGVAIANFNIAFLYQPSYYYPTAGC
ncbi:MAG: hypothetical protein U0Q22_14620 [Acidimicrobiales bacterium]